jgi:protoporphyrinogen oxidase
VSAPSALVLGGGIAGLAAARRLAEGGVATTVLEAEAEPGGLSRTIREDGFVCDLGPHFVESSLVDALGVQGECREVPYLESIAWRGRLHRFPLGLLRDPRLTAGVAIAAARSALANALRKGGAPAANLEEHLERAYGPRFARSILAPLLEKWSGAPADALSPEVARRFDPPHPRILLHHLKVLLTGRSLHLRGGSVTWMAPRGGIDLLIAALVRGGGFAVETRTPVSAVEVAAGRVCGVVAGAELRRADLYVSTLPAPMLARFAAGAPALAPLGALRTRALALVFLRLRRPPLFTQQWIWLPEPCFTAYRVSEPADVDRSYAPLGKTMLCAEVGLDEEPDPEELGRLVTAELGPLGVRRDEVLRTDVRFLPHAYPVYLRSYERERASLGPRSALSNLFFAGRFGLMRHLMLEGAYHSGIEAATTALASLGR